MQYQIIIEESDIPVLSAALIELPYKIAAPLIGKINRQIADQSKNEDNPAPSGASPDSL